jgi:hypothetical protein
MSIEETVFGRFEFLALGRGDMNVVYRTRYRHLHRDVAVKMRGDDPS